MIFLLGELKLFCLKIILPIFLLLRSRVRVILNFLLPLSWHQANWPDIRPVLSTAGLIGAATTYWDFFHKRAQRKQRSIYMVLSSLRAFAAHSPAPQLSIFNCRSNRKP